jgi:nucleoside-diphosphate-sugar epimerase
MRVERPLPSEDLEYVRREAAGLWPDLKGARLFITGATGFFGRWLLESLFLANERDGLGAHVVALSRNPDTFLHAAPHLAIPGLRWLKGSVATLAADALTGEKFDMVIHLATEANMQVTAGDPQAAIGVITDGTRRVLEAAVRTGARRFLFTSSGAVYGSQPSDMEQIPETYEGRPNPMDGVHPYALPGEAKRQAEVLCVDYARRKGLCAVIARCFTFAGPGLPTEGKFAFGNFMSDAIGSRPIQIKGDGTTVRSYLYAADLAIWLWTLLLRGTRGRAYNVGSEQPITMSQLAEIISNELGAQGIEILQQPRPGGAIDRYVPSTQRARGELGLQEKFSLPEIVQRTAAWQRTAVKH